MPKPSTTSALGGRTAPDQQIDLQPQEVSAIVDQASRAVPAASLRGILLSGLVNLQRRRLARDADSGQPLQSGLNSLSDSFTYWFLFAAPAAAIGGYQKLLKVLGKTPEQAFPDGTWQFYIEYALREDTARHANETHGFDTVLAAHDIRLPFEDRLTAWVMAASHILHQYPDLLANEWRERVYTDLLRQVAQDTPQAGRMGRVYVEWLGQLPYRRGHDARQNETYPAYRRRKFDQFLANVLKQMPEDLQQAWRDQARQATRQDLAAYQRQMSILAYLEPSGHGEARRHYEVSKAAIGIIFRRHYYLVPASQPDGSPPEVETVRAQIASILAQTPELPPARLETLAEVRRAALPQLRSHLHSDLQHSLEALRYAPILLNADLRPYSKCLAEVRRTERGIGDHPLTLVPTSRTMVFDQSHIFFDGAWGAALAEILTNEALSWAVYLSALDRTHPAPKPITPLPIRWRPKDVLSVSNAPQVTREAWAETERGNIKAIMALRKLFKRRSDLVQLTANDILVLYRAIHAATYQPSPELLAVVQSWAHQNPGADSPERKAAVAALEALFAARPENPGILIPVDASRRYPRDRLYPMTFEVPLEDLDLINQHRKVVQALETYRTTLGDRDQAYQAFDWMQRVYLTTLAGFGGVMARAKELANTGETASVGSIRLLAHMPVPLQRLLDNYSGQFDALNDVIKGRDVFSNVGQVAPNSTLTRFISAKDDNEKKDLVWGVLTDTQGVMRISLRDFRAHVGLLVQAGQQELANQVAQDYLESYAAGLNQYVHDLRRITVASRETRMGVPAEPHFEV